MSILLGIRMAFAGGRESIARMALMAIGVAMGLPLILLALSALPVMQSHIDRLAWHRTTAESPPTAPDRALWLAVTDRYAGRDIIRVHIAPLGPQPPVPPGVQRLPGPGEKLVSPALAKLLPTVPEDQLGNRFPGRIAGTIGPDGLIMPGELVAIIGQTPDEMRTMPGAYEIRGIEQPGERMDLAELWGIFFGILAFVVIGPIVVFVILTTRIGGARREQRFAAVRLAGATRFQTAVLAATETAGAAITGTLLGGLLFLALRPVVASQVTLGHDMPVFPGDIAVPRTPLFVVMVGVPLLAVLTTLVALNPVQLAPLGIRRHTTRRRPGVWRLALIAVGLVGYWYAADPDNAEKPWVGQIAALSMALILIGFFLAGAWVCMWISRGLARLSRTATTLIVARRIEADPYSTFRVVGGAAVAIYAATLMGFAVSATGVSGPDGDSAAPVGSTLDPGVVAVHMRGVPEASLAALMSDGVVVARLAPQQRIAVSCADLARVTILDCPLPEFRADGNFGPDYLRAEDLFALPYPHPDGSDHIFHPESFVEPGPGDAELPVQTLFIPTDGSSAAQERVRTLAATTAPMSRSKVSEDLVSRPINVTGLANVLPYATVFILLVAAFSLTVSAITGVLERCRPFALLRASGMRLGELRAIVLLETGVPLIFTVLLGVGLATLQSLATVSLDDWVLPSGGYIAGLGIGLIAAFAVSLIALPFMDTVTSHEGIRFE